MQSSIDILKGLPPSKISAFFILVTYSINNSSDLYSNNTGKNNFLILNCTLTNLLSTTGVPIGSLLSYKDLKQVLSEEFQFNQTETPLKGLLKRLENFCIY